MKNSELLISAFKAYDIRGIVPEIINEHFSYRLGLTIAKRLHAKNIKSILIGRDGRLSSLSITHALVDGIRDNYINVINIGEVPTPVVYFATHKYKTNSAIVVTASHNPSDYNGFKIVIDGKTLYEKEIYSLRNEMIKNNKRSFQTRGTIENINIIDDYINEVCSNIKICRPMSIMIDAGNGVAGPTAIKLFNKLGCKLQTLFCQIDGSFPNHIPDPSNPKNLEELISSIKRSSCEIGLAFDGDGDRLGVVTKNGIIIWPDRQMILFASELLKKIPNAKIIYDIKCSQNLRKSILKSGGIPIIWKSGHSLIKYKIKETNAILAGEMSGHFFFKDKWYGFDDGIYAGVRLLEILSHFDDPSMVLESLPDSISTPEIRIDTKSHKESRIIVEEIKNNLMNIKSASINTIDGIRIDYDSGFGLIRASNTTSSIVMRFEASNENEMLKIKKIFLEKLIITAPWLEIPDDIYPL